MAGSRFGRSEARLRVVGATSGEAGPAALDETGLVWRARAGDVAALETLYRTHFRDLLRHVSYATGDVAVAEDLTQESFARAFAKLAEFDERSSFRVWVRGIARNLVRKRWRTAERQSRAFAKVEHAPTRGHEPEAELVRDRRAEVLARALQSLPASQREAFVLCDVEGMSAAEAAVLTETTPVNVRVRATRARARLHELLVAQGWLTAEGRAR